MTNERTFAITPMPMVVLHQDQPHQVCRLTLPSNLADDARLELVRDDGQHAWNGDALTAEILLPEVAAPITGEATLSSGDDSWSATVEFAPVRRWNVFLVNHSHTDIGFTHTYLDCIDIHVKNLRMALEAIDATADWPSESRMRWTVESAWQVQHYLRAYPEDREGLAAAVRAGLIEIEALYIHSYFDILSREQLVRSLSLAETLRAELDIPITSAMICDVPGCSWSLVDLLAASGVQYLAMAPNNFIAPFHAQTDLERPFIWQGPAGGRVLVWYTGDPSWAYVEGTRFGFWDSLQTVEQKLPEHLAELESDGYSYDAVQIQLSSDNRPLRMLPASIARKWNAKYLSPKITIATTSQFFRHMEARYSERFPVVSGEWQSSWSETSLHYPHEAALSRRNHHTLSEWERFATIAGWMNEVYTPPLQAIDDAYDASLLFDEHGGPKGIWLPRSDEEELAAIVQGYGLFEAETEPAMTGRADALRATTGAQRTGDDPVAVVWNLCDWPRSAPVGIEPGDLVDSLHAYDEETGESAPVIAFDDGSLQLLATDVPPRGFRRYRLSSDSSEAPPWPTPAPEIRCEGDHSTIENERFTLTIDKSGAIISLIDRNTGRELIDSTSWPGGNAFTRYVTDPNGPGPGGDFHADRRLYDGIAIGGHIIEPSLVEQQDITLAAHPGSATVSTGATFDNTYAWHTDITVHRDWIEVRNRLSWLQNPPEPEMLYVVFPFALDSPEIRHASQLAVVDPKRQTLSGSAHDSFAIQEWTDLSTNGAGVTVSSDDLPLVDYGGINLRQFHTQVNPEHGVLAFRAAHYNPADELPGSPWGNLPYLELRFAIRPYSGQFDARASHRFGEEQASPLVAQTLPAKHPGEWRQPSASFIALESDTAMIAGLKPASDGRGTIVRLWESSGQRTTARLTFPQHQLLRAWRTSPGGRDLGRMEIADNAVTLELDSFQLVNLRCQVGR